MKYSCSLKLSRVYRLILSIVGVVVMGCTTPTVVSPTIMPSVPNYTPSEMTPTPAPCCRERRSPPLCGLVPSQSSVENVRQALGNPVTIRDVEPGMDFFSKRGPDVIWGYPHSCPVGVYFKNESIFAISYPLKTKRNLDDIVAEYGPPESVCALPYLLSEEDIETEYWGVAFLWPAQGVSLTASLWEAGFEPLDPVALAQDRLPPFPPDLPITYVDYFQPTDLAEVTAWFFAGNPLASWPGMTE